MLSCPPVSSGKYRNEFSNKIPCTSGVSQGGALSPLLFLMYTADLPEILKVRPSVKIRMCADDIRIYCSYASHEQPEAHRMLSLVIEKMLEWCNRWDIPLNRASIRSESSVNDLGVLVNDLLTFNDHFTTVARIALNSLFVILRNVHRNAPALL
ncbi:hypothetical protein OSTOST_22190, partial [Ostertagia ostertagi]